MVYLGFGLFLGKAMFSFLDLRTRIVTTFLLLVAFTVLVIGINTYRVNYNILLSQLQNSLDKSLENLQDSINAATLINSQSLSNYLEQMKPAFGGFALLINADNTIFAADKATVVKQELLLDSKIELSALQENSLLRVSKLHFSPISVVVGIEKEKFDLPLRQLGYSMLICVMLSLILALIVGLWLTNKIAQPISDLIEGLKAAGEGVYSIRLQCSADSEIAESLQAFNSLMEKLQKQRLIEKLWHESWEA